MFSTKQYCNADTKTIKRRAKPCNTLKWGADIKEIYRV